MRTTWQVLCDKDTFITAKYDNKGVNLNDANYSPFVLTIYIPGELRPSLLFLIHIVSLSHTPLLIIKSFNFVYSLFNTMVSTQSKLAVAFISALLPGSLAQLFTVNCAPLTFYRGDPIIFPGVISPHVHAIVGGTRFALSLTNDQAANAKATTCDKSLDKSNYWQPQLYHQRRDGKFEMVEMQGIVSAALIMCQELGSFDTNMYTLSRLLITLPELVTTLLAGKTAMVLLMPKLRQRDFAWLSEIQHSGTDLVTCLSRNCNADF